MGLKEIGAGQEERAREGDAGRGEGKENEWPFCVVGGGGPDAATSTPAAGEAARPVP